MSAHTSLSPEGILQQWKGAERQLNQKHREERSALTEKRAAQTEHDALYNQQEHERAQLRNAWSQNLAAAEKRTPYALPPSIHELDRAERMDVQRGHEKELQQAREQGYSREALQHMTEEHAKDAMYLKHIQAADRDAFKALADSKERQREQYRKETDRWNAWQAEQAHKMRAPTPADRPQRLPSAHDQPTRARQVPPDSHAAMMDELKRSLSSRKSAETGAESPTHPPYPPAYVPPTEKPQSVVEAPRTPAYTYSPRKKRKLYDPRRWLGR